MHGGFRISMRSACGKSLPALPSASDASNHQPMDIDRQLRIDCDNMSRLREREDE